MKILTKSELIMVRTGVQKFFVKVFYEPVCDAKKFFFYFLFCLKVFVVI